MAAVPPPYGDLGKSARDLFNKGYSKFHLCTDLLMSSTVSVVGTVLRKKVTELN